VAVPGDQWDLVVEATLGYERVRDFGAVATAHQLGTELSSPPPISGLDFELLYPEDELLQRRRN
jgi:hypothetical protein